MKKRILTPLLLLIFSLFASAQLKEPLAGLACRDFKRIQSTDDDVMKNINVVVVQLHWNDIQPKEGGPIVHENDLDRAIKWVHDFKQKYGVDIGLKVRLYCGIYSPDWLMKKVGAFSARGDQYPRFWKDDYINAFAELQKKLAAEYDNVPEVREMVDGATGIRTAENFIRPFNAGPNGQEVAKVFQNAGYSSEVDSIAIVKSFDAMKVWKKTLVSVCFSDWKTIDKNGNADEDVNRTFGFIHTFVNDLGKQAVVGNNGLRPGLGHHGERWQEGGDMFTLYNQFKKMHDEQGVKVYFQTAKDERIGNLSDAIKDGISYGASYIELPGTPRAYTQDLTLSSMPELNKELKANVKG